ncbi:MAG: hypothetical protein K2K29_03965, partial [Muribaculaceae bacterium]|nr:hypothetical protein [Muribaculaceae bacterium]
MALDKNNIPLTNSLLLKPALEYYIKHGSPDKRMRTRYYEGAVNLDCGNYVRAMECFLDAISDTAAVYTDSLGLALVYIGQGVTYGRQSRMNKFIELNRKAVEIYKSRGDSVRVAEGLVRIMSGYAGMDDSIGRAASLNEIERYLPVYSKIPDKIMPSIVSATVCSRPKSISQHLLDSIYESKNDNKDLRMALAFGYSALGNTDRSLELIDEIRNSGEPYDTIRALLICSQCYEKSGEFREALQSYKQFYLMVENDVNHLMNDDLLYTRQRHDINEENKVVIEKKDKIIYASVVIILSILLVAAILLYVVRTKVYKNKILQLKCENLEDTLMQGKQDMQDMIARISSLSESLDMIKDDNSELRTVNLELTDKNSNLTVHNELLSERLKNSLNTGMTFIDDIMRMEITGKKKYGERFESLKEAIHKNQNEFFSILKNHLRISHPNFMNHLDSLSLNEDEYNIV